MFCYLYVMFDRTSLPLYEKEKCFDECEFCKDGECGITIRRAENLTSDKFGWIVDTVIVFNEAKISKSGSTRYLSSLCLIHPSTPDIWIMRCERLDKTKEEEEWYTVYRLYKSGDCIEYDDLKSLNRWLRNQRYDGRSLEEEDFTRKEGE